MTARWLAARGEVAFRRFSCHDFLEQDACHVALSGQEVVLAEIEFMRRRAARKHVYHLRLILERLPHVRVAHFGIGAEERRHVAVHLSSGVIVGDKVGPRDGVGRYAVECAEGVVEESCQRQQRCQIPPEPLAVDARGRVDAAHEVDDGRVVVEAHVALGDVHEQSGCAAVGTCEFGQTVDACLTVPDVSFTLVQVAVEHVQGLPVGPGHVG